MIQYLKPILKVIRPVHRLYPMGTVGLGYWDDRTWLEKKLDSIEDRIKDYERSKRERRSHIWHTFFDISTGTYISSMSDIRKIEREKGWTYADFKDIHKEAEKHDKYNMKAQGEMVRKDIAKLYKDVKQGRKFTHEIQDKINKGQYRTGRVEAANG